MAASRILRSSAARGTAIPRSSLLHPNALPGGTSADMHPGEDRDRGTALYPGQQVGVVMGTEIGLLLRQRLVDLRARPPFDVADVGEPFGTQQRLGDVLRSAADARVLFQPHGR